MNGRKCYYTFNKSRALISEEIILTEAVNG